MAKKTFNDLIKDTLANTSDEQSEYTKNKQEEEKPKESSSNDIEDDIECLLCSIMEAIGKPRSMFSDFRPEKIPGILGGDMEVIISLGGPEEAYKEDKILDMFKDILPGIKVDKEYTIEDIKEIRKKKASHGASMKKLLALMDDNNIRKAFNGMQIFKKGGQKDDKQPQAIPAKQVREEVSGELITIPDNTDPEQKIIKTTKGEVVNIKGKYYFMKNIPEEYGGLKKHAEGGQLSSMSTVKASIGNKEYTLYEAKTEEEKRQGLKGVTDLADDEGMIFYNESPEDVVYVMEDCEIPLTLCFFDEDEECISVKQGHPLNNETIEEKGVSFVVELNENADVQPGDILDLPGDDDEYVMHVLAPDGTIQMSLKSGERIHSRISTRVILKKYKQAIKNKDDEEMFERKCKSLGKYVFKEWDAQDGRKAEYVQLNK